MPQLKPQNRPFLFRGQDFHKLRAECLAQGKLFEDPEFPANDTSLKTNFSRSRKLEWKRPSELMKNPKFIAQGGTRFDIKQGSLGDCWVLSGLASVTLKENLFRFVVPYDQSYEENYAGIFHFRIWRFGTWVDVVVDDRLPNVWGKVVFSKSAQGDEFWSALFEKAYAKVNGSYAAISGGSPAVSMEDFTGGIAEQITISKAPEDLYDILHRAYKGSAMISSAVHVQNDKNLPKNHAYSVTRVEKVNEETKLVRVRNPWGNSVEWQGKWGDSSPEWERVPQWIRKNLELVSRADGEFWMEFDDFAEFFSNVYICHLSPMCFRNVTDTCSREPSKLEVFVGAWTPGVSAGGKFEEDTFWTNPQFLVTLEQKDEQKDAQCTLIVAVMQKDRREKYRPLGEKDLSLGLYLFPVPTPEKQPKPLPPSFFSSARGMVAHGFWESREVIRRFSLAPGSYCLVPAASQKNRHGTFMLRFYADTNYTVTEYDRKIEDFNRISKANNGVPKGITFRDHSQRVFGLEDVEQFEKIFQEESEGNEGKIDFSQLSRILQKTVRDDLYNNFTRDVIEAMVEAFGKTASGFEGFKALVDEIVRLMVLFEHYDQSKSGYISVLDLGEILTASGFDADHYTLSAIDVAYGSHDGKIDLEDYLTVCLKLKALTAAPSFEDEVDAQVESFYDWLHMLLTM